MAPTVLREGGFRLFFFSREEARMHVHVHHSGGEAKFWLEPSIALAQNYGLSDKQLGEAERIIRSYEQSIRQAWEKHFGT